MSSNTCITLTAIVLWTASNVGVLLLNKFLLTNTGFKQPVFLTLCHMMACCSLAFALSLTKSFPIKPLKSRRQAWKVCLLATIFCITIVAGNMSLKYIPVSFSQAVGAATPFFTAAFALMLQGTRESGATYATLIPIVVGVTLASGGEPSFHLLGFLACLLATAGRALKSVVQGMIMSDPTEKLDPMSLLFYMASFSVLLLLPATTVLEPNAFERTRALMATNSGFVWWLLFNSFTAYAVNLTNFMVTKYTSALTLQVLGNMKGVIAAAVSVALFRNAVTAKGMVGYAITVAGVFMYSAAKRRAAAMRAAEAATKLGADEATAEPLIKAIGSGGSALGSAASGGSGFSISFSSGKEGLLADGGRGSSVSSGSILPTSTQQLRCNGRGSSGTGGVGGFVGGMFKIAVGAN